MVDMDRMRRVFGGDLSKGMHEMSDNVFQNVVCPTCGLGRVVTIAADEDAHETCIIEFGTQAGMPTRTRKPGRIGHVVHRDGRRCNVVNVDPLFREALAGPGDVARGDHHDPR